MAPFNSQLAIGKKGAPYFQKKKNDIRFCEQIATNGLLPVTWNMYIYIYLYTDIYNTYAVYTLYIYIDILHIYI